MQPNEVTPDQPTPSTATPQTQSGGAVPQASQIPLNSEAVADASLPPVAGPQPNAQPLVTPSINQGSTQQVGSSRPSSPRGKRLLIIAGVAIAIGILAGIDSSFTHKGGSPNVTGSSSSLRTISTPCYSTKIDSSQQDNSSVTGSNNCHVATKYASGSDTYEIIASNNTSLTASTLQSEAQTQAQQFVSGNSGSKIMSQESEQFAGSPAYIMTIDNGSGGTATIVLVYHQSNGYNSYTIDRFVNQGTSDLGSVASNWQWK